MAKIKPFAALRPTAALAQQVAALPYDVMNSAEAREMVKDNPYSFLHVDKAEIDLPEDIDPYSEDVYTKAKESLSRMIADGTYIREDKPCLYLYRQIMDGRVQTGIVACASVDDYLNNVIKKHEKTRADKEADRIHHVDTLNAQTGPIFLTYRSREHLDQLTDKIAAGVPLYDFDANGVQQTVWLIDDQATINEIVIEFGAAGDLYIADGHHRNASAVRVAQMRRQTNPKYSSQESFNYFLCVLFPDQQLKILDYNRVVKDLNGLNTPEFLDAVAENFYIITSEDNQPCRPAEARSFGMYLDGQWYLLKAKPGICKHSDPVEGLDVSILQNYLLSPVLGIEDPRTDKRIDFIGGIRGLAELERRVNDGMAVAFSMHPTSIRELMAIADADKLMPPKSTWFEPKLLSGLFIHDISI